MIGTTISHYTILEKLGEGGMGVVYKAQDLTLDRQVALKFLPAHVSASEDTKARFLQEAKAAAALNHAHICTIHGVDEADGSMFIVMEYVDGGTLRTRLPFASVDDAVNAAVQIAEALQEAHAKGIVHRDIKADNIMLTSKGQAKVMDFGLAKLKGSLKLTRTSSTVGTLAYMAPEQIQGGSVDTRSDVFSFGALLFEMLTGKTPFRGEHEASMLYSIVNEEPQALDAFRQDVSPLLSNLILKCLEKDPADRYQHMDDIVSELRRSQKKTSKVMRTSSQMSPHPQSGSPASEPVSTSALPASDPRDQLKRFGLYGGIVVVLAVVAWLVLMPGGIRVNPNMTTRVLQVPFTQFSYPSLSPDGKWIAFPAADANGKWDIYFMNVNGGDARRITSDHAAFIQQSTDISDDGSQILYERPSEDGLTIDVCLVSALGGTSRTLAKGAINGRLQPHGTRAGFIRTENARHRSQSGMMEFWTVGTDGSDLRREFVDSAFVQSSGYRYNYCWAPDGKSIAWVRTIAGSKQVIVVFNLQTGEQSVLTAGEENIDDQRWTPEGRIIFSSNRGGNTNLWAIPASGGEAVQVTKGAGPDIGLSIASSANSVVYLQQQRVSNIWRANSDGSLPRQLTQDDREAFQPSFSPDGKRIAFVMTDPDPLKVYQDIYVVDRDGNNRRQLTHNLMNTFGPVWSPDGKRICFTIGQSGLGDTSRPKMYMINADDPGTPRFVGNYYAITWPADDYMLATTGDGAQPLLVQLSTATTRPFFRDSALILYMGEDGLVGYFDRRRSTRGWWVTRIDPAQLSGLFTLPGDTIMPRVVQAPLRIPVPSGTRTQPNRTSAASAGGMVIDYTESGVFVHMSFPQRTRRSHPVSFESVRTLSLDLSSDGKEVTFSIPRINARLVLAENVFE